MELTITKTESGGKRRRPDERALGFGKYFSDHMFVMDYTSDEGWNDARIVPYESFLVSPAAMVFHYGQAVFEGLKCYRTGKDTALLFRPQKNFERMNASNERMCIPRIDPDFAMKAMTELIRTDFDWIPSLEGTSLYIRPFVIATEAALGVHPSRNFKFMIILSPVGAYYAKGLAPVRILVEDEYVRAVRGGIGTAKSSANYAASLKGQEKAIARGYEQTLWLDGVEREYIEEVGTMNVFFKLGGEIVTPELSGSILPGVTRDSVIALLRKWGLTVTERKLSVNEIFDAAEKGLLEESFGSGTAAVISPVSEYVKGDKSVKIGNGEIGPIAQRLYDELTGIQYGRAADDLGWMVAVSR